MEQSKPQRSLRLKGQTKPQTSHSLLRERSFTSASPSWQHPRPCLRRCSPRISKRRRAAPSLFRTRRSRRWTSSCSSFILPISGNSSTVSINCILLYRTFGFVCAFFDFRSLSFDRIQTHKRLRRTLFIRTKTQSANVPGNPLCQATKRHLNNS